MILGRLTRLLAPLLILVFVTSCQKSPNGTPSSRLRTQGISSHIIRLGSSCALSGHASFLGTQTIHGALAYINHINDEGGVHGRRIELITYDDGYDPPRCVVNTQRLINDDRVFALFNYVGMPTADKIIPLVEEAKIPLVGLFTGANALRNPFKRYIINIRASYYQETRNAVHHFVEELNLKKIAVLYQYDAYGFDGLRGTELALGDYGLRPVAKGSYTRGRLNVEGALDKIASSEAEAVFMVGTYEPCAKFIKLSHARGFHPVFYCVSFVGAEEILNRLGKEGEGVIITQVVPPPSKEAILPTAREYNRLLARYFPEDKPNFVSFEGFINAKVLVEGLRRAGQDLDRESFVDAIDTIQNFSLGIANTLSFSPHDHQGLEHVYFTRIERGRLNLITNWKKIRAEISVPGVTPSKIVFGSSCALSGHASFLGTQTIHGAFAYIKHINEKGGIHDRKIKLIAYDDGYDPSRCVDNTLRLINEDKVFALFSYIGMPAAQNIIPLVEKAKIPLVGLFSGASVLRTPFKRYIINIRAPYHSEIGAVVSRLVEDMGIKRFAVFYQDDDYGLDGLAGTRSALGKYGLSLVAEDSYKRGTLEVEAAAKKILPADPEAVILVGTYAPCASFIELAKRSGYKGQFYCVSFVGTEELAKRLGRYGEGVIVTQVVPPPWETALFPAAEEYTRLLTQHFPKDKPNFVSFEGFINAKVLVEAFRRMGREINREKLIETIEEMEEYSPGIGANINFGIEDHQGLDKVYFTRIKNGRPYLFTLWGK